MSNNINTEKRTTILVTGATGTVGSEVVKQLVSIPSSAFSNHHIRAAIHSQNKTARLKQFTNNGVEITDLDYTKPETIVNALDKVDKLFLQTLPVPDMVDITSNLIKETKRDDVKHIIKLSAMGAGSEPESTILRTHGEEEKIIEESGIPYTFLRPDAFMQNFITQFGYTIRTQNAFYAPAGDSKLGFVDARDIADIAARILTNSNNNGSEGLQHLNKAYEITGSDTLSYSQVAEILSTEVGKKISYIDVTEEDARKGMKQTGADDWLVNIVLELFRIIRGGYGAQITTVVEQITGRKPITFGQFAKDYAKFFR